MKKHPAEGARASSHVTAQLDRAEILYGIGALPEGRRRMALAAAATAMFAEPRI